MKARSIIEKLPLAYKANEEMNPDSGHQGTDYLSAGAGP